MLAGKSYLVVGINAIVRIYLVERDNEVLERIAEVDSQIITYKLKVVSEKVVSRRNEHVRILVADIMKSLTVYKFSHYPDNNTGERFRLVARDPNGLWCIEMAHLPNIKSLDDEEDDSDLDLDDTLSTDEFYLTADFDQNLNLLQKFKNVDPAKADLLQIKASAFIGQQVTSIGQFTKRAGPLQNNMSRFLQAHPTDVFISPSYLQTQHLPRNQSFFSRS